MHPRKLIRSAVVAMLKATNTAAADRVWAGEQPPVDVQAVLIGEGPVILVYTRDDRVAELSATGDNAQKRECTLCVEILAAGALAVEDKLDDLAEQVEGLVDLYEVPGMPSAEIRLQETNVETTSQFEKPVGGAFLSYQACYWRPWREPPPEPAFPCPIDVGVRINGGPRESLDVSCDCGVDH